MPNQNEISMVKRTHKQTILKNPNVVGLGIGYKVVKGRQTDTLALVTLVRQKLPEAGLKPQMKIPKTIDAVPTDVIEVGVIRALQSRTDRWRPAPGGVSIGHYQITAGTLGVVVRDRATQQRLILSNNHVLANSNDASPGDPIIQPGAADGGQVSSDTIAHLERFCPIVFNTEPPDCDLAGAYVSLGNFLANLTGSKHRVKAFQEDPAATNLVDAAVARPINDADVLDEILEIGEIAGLRAPELGLPVRKSGRTTGFTSGEILLIDATVNVSYGVGRMATFENQLVAGPMSQGGDSGSLVVAGDAPQAVGLLFAGSDQSTIFSPIQAVLDCLEIDL